MKRQRSKAAESQLEREASQSRRTATRVLEGLKKAASSTSAHPFRELLTVYKESKHPILQTLEPQPEVYKTNPDKKKKPIELYLDTVNTLYKKKDLDMLISPLSVVSVYEKWSPREIAKFQLAIVRFGKQFEFISQLVQTKTTKQVYEFYLEWKTTSHYKSYKTNKTLANRSNYESLV